jgi:hypothetical protein
MPELHCLTISPSGVIGTEERSLQWLSGKDHVCLCRVSGEQTFRRPVSQMYLRVWSRRPGFCWQVSGRDANMRLSPYVGNVRDAYHQRP